MVHYHSAVKWLILTKNSDISVNLGRRISTAVWKNPFTEDVKRELEEYWSRKLRCEDQFNAADLKDKYFVLSMFPYPSGNLHIGHVRAFTISDTVARFLRMNGKNVFQPMGWDSFGLPAENAALERGVSPDEWTAKNIAQMKIQMKKLFFSFDWQSEVTTSSPAYYRWTQYLFLKMYDAGLVYQKEAIVNWDPVDCTVLADEQVDEEGRAWRSSVLVEKKVFKQWFIRTTKFSKDLYEGLEKHTLHTWVDVATIQKNWIGKCDGYSFDLKVKSSDTVTDTNVLNVWVYDPLDIVEAEFIAIKPNSIVDILASTRDANSKLDFSAVNPFTGCMLPIYVSNDVPYAFGRDSYVGLPSKSEADLEFARKVELKLRTAKPSVSRDKICETGLQLGIGGYPVSWRAKDWLISRQRYWGTPIPIVHCDKCGVQPVPYDQLPVVLPPLPKDYEIGKGLREFLKTSEWIRTTCPKCGGVATREIDTMDTFVDSSWYYLRYVDVNNTEEPFSSSIANQMIPVDLYVGGIEHAAQHLYYARFVSYFLHSIGLVKEPEPFTSVLCQGMIKGKTYKTLKGKYLKPKEVKITGDTAVCKKTEEPLAITWEKMSKSKYNGIEPSQLIKRHGVDTIRLALLSHVPPWCDQEWDEKIIKTVIGWQYKVWLTIKEFLTVRGGPLVGPQAPVDMDQEKAKLKEARNIAVRNITYHFRHTHNLGNLIDDLSAFMVPLRDKFTTREVRKYTLEYERSLAAFIIMLAPIAPHLAASLWFGFTAAPDRIKPDNEEIDWDANVLQQKWPKLDRDFALPITFMVNGHSAYSTPVSQKVLKTLTLEGAMKYAEADTNLHAQLCTKPILSTNFRVVEDYGAEVFIKVRRDKLANATDASEGKITNELSVGL